VDSVPITDIESRPAVDDVGEHHLVTVERITEVGADRSDGAGDQELHLTLRGTGRSHNPRGDARPEA
jgi:hypothetical protein